MGSTKLETLDNPPIAPIFQQRFANQTIALGAVKASFPALDKSKSPPRHGRARLSFARSDSLEFVIKEPNAFLSYFSRSNDPPTSLVLTSHGISLDVYYRTSTANNVIYSPSLHPVQIFQPSNNLSRATFHLMNWPDFLGPSDYVLRTGEPPHYGLRRTGRAVMKMMGWEITVCALPNIDDLLKSLKKHNGYAITHVGEIQRADGSPFTSEELDDLIACLKHFYSFALGRWTGPSLVVGFDKHGVRAFEQWGLNKTAHGPWEGSHSWFDYHHAELLTEALPGFAALWNNPIWNQSIRESIYWYVGANGGARTGGVAIGIDASLLLSQTALELLAWTYCVKDRKLCAESKFRPGGLSAPKKLRLMISNLGLSEKIPAHFTALQRIAQPKSGDALDVLTALRNGLVHPDSTRLSQAGAYYEAWRLSLQYIELVLLRLCGHTGNYANRLVSRFAGQVESVPWESP